MKLSREIILISDIINYSIKGLTGALGKGEGVTKSITYISFHVPKNYRIEDFGDKIASSNLLKEGDIIVVPSKVIAILEQRFVYGLTIENYNKCITDFDFAKKYLKMADKNSFTKRDQIGLDKIDSNKKIGVRYPKNPNLSAYKIAKIIQGRAKIKIDVVISDSDSGGVKGLGLIGCPTIITTPIGATKGIRFFYCMRAAVAADLVWNNKKDIPVVVIKPYQASRIRKEIGKLRYKGFLDANREYDVTSILKGK